MTYMDWNLFWTALGAIGSTLCAMATIIRLTKIIEIIIQSPIE